MDDAVIGLFSGGDHVIKGCRAGCSNRQDLGIDPGSQVDGALDLIITHTRAKGDSHSPDNLRGLKPGRCPLPSRDGHGDGCGIGDRPKIIVCTGKESVLAGGHRTPVQRVGWRGLGSEQG